MRTFLFGVAAIAMITAPVAAQAGAVGSETAPGANAMQRFAPVAGAPADYKLDFTVWDTALNWFVLSMGKSLRVYQVRPTETTGSRGLKGHDSPYRLEGNRVAFSLLPADVKQALTDYRRDLEQLPDQVPLTRLPRNEQLAYWINLHNVAAIEQLALAYPLSQPRQLKIGGTGLPFDKAPVVTVAGVPLSLNDIRTRIVYPNWSDPKVMYGFWTGEIGGPSISRIAYTGTNVGELLDVSAREFVNSLRATERRGDTLAVSRYFLEAQPFYFTNFEADLRRHLQQYTNPEVAGMIGKTSRIQAVIEEPDIADLSKGEIDTAYNALIIDDEVPSIRLDGTVARLMRERSEKLKEIWQQNGRQGRVIFQDVGEAAKPVEAVK